MTIVNGIDLDAPLYVSIVCPCGNQLQIPVVRGWAVAGLSALRFTCLECHREYGQEWKIFPKVVVTEVVKNGDDHEKE